jgi:hypothetical protein
VPPPAREPTISRIVFPGYKFSWAWTAQLTASATPRAGIIFPNGATSVKLVEIVADRRAEEMQIK